MTSPTATPTVTAAPMPCESAPSLCLTGRPHFTPNPAASQFVARPTATKAVVSVSTKPQLAQTGPDVGPQVGIAVALFGVGVALFRFGRRKPKH